MNLQLLTLLLLYTSTQASPRPRVPWRKQAVFVLDDSVSDEFSGNSLDESKWDPHGLRNPDTGCPKWNGPPSPEFPEYSTYYPTVNDPQTGEAIHQQYRVSGGKLELFMREKPLEFFTSREYYCNATTFHCNHDETLPCYSTGIDGKPLRNPDGSFRGLLHDKCKREPFCIPHPEYVTGKERVYKRFVANHIVSKQRVKYGYFEAKVKLPPTPVLTAVWMHDDNLVNGWCRWRRSTDPNVNFNILECPSATRSRRWMEIDMLEAMNTQIHKRRYIPNIHAFAMYKGEFSSREAVDNGDGSMGGGPIILMKNVFSQKHPSFADVSEAEKVGNDFHWSPGSVHELNADWGRKTRTMGCYWSPNEIRFYVDGVEVKRLNNTIIHQPMYIDLSNAWNIAWGRDIPTKRDIRKSKSKIMYMRRWEVFTEGGVDPPSTLPLDDVMERRFDNRYGNELFGVLGKFPVWDNLTVLPTIPEEPDVIEPTPNPPNAELGEALRFNLDAAGLEERVLWDQLDKASGRSVDVASFNSSRDYFSDQIDQLTMRMRREKKNDKLIRAGGAGNLRFSPERKQMNRKERQAAEANPQRETMVEGDGMPKPMKDGATTVFEFADPNMPAAGWDTVDGSGRQITGL